MSHDVSTGSKTAEFRANEKTIYWGIRKMFGNKNHLAKFKVSFEYGFLALAKITIYFLQYLMTNHSFVSKVNLPFISASSRQEIGPIRYLGFYN